MVSGEALAALLDHFLEVENPRTRPSQTKGQKAIHLVSAIAHGLRVTQGNMKNAEKSYEIKTIRDLLEALLLKDCLATFDAMGCEKAIAANIIQQESDCALPVKNNRPVFAAAIECAFGASAALGSFVQGHRGVENNLHWSLDVVYRKDQARMHQSNTAENVSILRRNAFFA